MVALLTLVALVAGGQALALQAEAGAVSVGAVGALAGAALIGGGAAVVLAFAAVATDAIIRRPPLYTSIYNLGTLTAAGLAAAFTLSFGPGNVPMLEAVGFGIAAGAVYYAVNTSLLTIAIALEEGRPFGTVWRRNFAWLMPHYLAYGLVGSVVAITYEEVHVYALAVFLVPLALMRATQMGQLQAVRESEARLQEAASTIHRKNVSLEEANRLLRTRSTEALEGLSATVDARDAYTAGHSRRVREIAVCIGNEIGLSREELEILAHAALFHDIGKIAVPDAILMKPGALSESERAVMQIHPEEGAEIVSRLGFLADAVPAIRHHHENFDGSGYPAGLTELEIPLGARIIHVADALDAIMNARIYRPGRSLESALEELRLRSGSQFCPRCVEAIVAVAERDTIVGQTLAAAS
jgi:putative nucleotidyltransferase with HDIG domain